MASRATTKIIVVGGGGTIGSSTALHLVRSGYTPSNITVLDVYPIPSSQSAGNDLNKIMGIRLRNKVDYQLSLEAKEMWNNDPLFAPYFHNTGRLDCAGSKSGIAALEQQYQILLDAGLADSTEWLDSEEVILEKMPLLDRNQIDSWKAIFDEDGGWLAAAKAINAIGVFLKERGVRFAFGEDGTFKCPILRGDDECVGVETANGTKEWADKVVLATGAWSPSLIDLQDQCCSKAWVYAHLRLSHAEAQEYRGLPVVYNGDVGFFFEPDDNGVIKVCDEFPGFSKFKMHQAFGADSPKQISIPRSHAQHPTDTYPDASEESIRKAISIYLPRFKDQPLFNRTMCWCTDTSDASLLICQYPRWRNLYLATGDSGHSFKLLPNIGIHVVELLEGKLSEDLSSAWRWRPGEGDAKKAKRAAAPKDLSDLPGWWHDSQL